MIDSATKLFDGRKIDIQPFGGDDRGFIVTIDRSFSIWFNQDGDHFKYDGFEMGPYDPGDVTVFDNFSK